MPPGHAFLDCHQLGTAAACAQSAMRPVLESGGEKRWVTVAELWVVLESFLYVM